MRADGAARCEAEVGDDDVRPRLRHRLGVGLAENIWGGEKLLLAGESDHVDLERVAHPGFFQVGAEHAVDQADCGEVLHAREADPFHVVEEAIHDPERVGAVDACQHRRVLHDRQHLARHVHHDGVRVAVGQQPRQRAAARHPEAAGVVEDDEVNPARLLAFRREAGAGATADDGHAAALHVLEIGDEVGTRRHGRVQIRGEEEALS